MREDVLRSFGMAMDYLRRLLAEVPDEGMCSQPVPGMNHAAWIAGHLAHSFQAIGGEMGIAPWLPPDWAQQFGTGSRVLCDRAAYPSKEELVRQLDVGSRRLIDTLAAMSDAQLAEPLPDVRYRHIFPTIGSAILHILTVHTAIHLGQLSAWRRATGLTPVSDPL